MLPMVGGETLMIQLTDYVKEIIETGYGVSDFQKVTNPCVNFALGFAGLMLEEARKNGYADLEGLQIEISGGWQMLSYEANSIGFDEFIQHIERMMTTCFGVQFGQLE